MDTDTTEPSNTYERATLQAIEAVLDSVILEQSKCYAIKAIIEGYNSNKEIKQ